MANKHESASRRQHRNPPPSRRLVGFSLPIADIDATIKTMIDNNPDLSEKDKIIQSVPGIDQGTSQVLLAALPELGGGNRQEMAALVGLAPFAKDSGRKSGVRQISGGRGNVRSAMYMAVFNVVQVQFAFQDVL